MMTKPSACLLPVSRFLTSVLLLLALLASEPGLAQTRHLELADYAKITSVSDPQISPDGKSIVFVVSRPNLEQDRSDRQLVLIEIATGTQRVLTYERKGAGSPRWSPSGDRLAFVAVDGARKEAKPQVFILSMSGGARVTITQGYSLYHALKDSGVPVKFIAYPVAGHFPGDPVRATDVDRRWVEWMDQYLK